MTAKEEKNNKNNNPAVLVKNVQCWKGHAFIPNLRNNSLNITGSRNGNITANDDSMNINIISRHSNDITITSCSSNNTANDSIIIGSLSGRGS